MVAEMAAAGSHDTSFIAVTEGRRPRTADTPPRHSYACHAEGCGHELRREYVRIHTPLLDTALRLIRHCRLDTNIIRQNTPLLFRCH